MLTDTFKEIWAQVRQERKTKLEKVVEEMLTSNRNVGILIHENQFGVILSAELNDFVPFGEIRFVRKDVDIDRLVSPPSESGEGT